VTIPEVNGQNRITNPLTKIADPDGMQGQLTSPNSEFTARPFYREMYVEAMCVSTHTPLDFSALILK